jgi:hypothetical protein
VSESQGYLRAALPLLGQIPPADPSDPHGREVDRVMAAALRLMKHGSKDWVDIARALSSRVPDAEGKAVFNRGFGLGFALSLAQDELGWRRDGYVESSISTARASVWSVFSGDDTAVEHAELLAFAIDCGLFYGVQGESESPRSLADLEALMDHVFGVPKMPDTVAKIQTLDDAAASVARGFPIGKGWIEGHVERDTHEGVFNARPDGMTFIPLTGFPEHWQHRLYFWRQFTEARAIAATDVKGAMEAHAVLVGVDPTAELVLSHVDLPWGGNELVVIVPLEPFTVADWLRRFRAAGVPTTGDDDDLARELTSARSDRPAPDHSDETRRDGSLAIPDGMPAGWLADPSGRHDHRYWNGTAWTKHVSDKGKRSTDPL